MSSSSVPFESSGIGETAAKARSKVVSGIFRLRSTLTESTSLFEVSNSSQAPRLGISLPMHRARPLVASSLSVK